MELLLLFGGLAILVTLILLMSFSGIERSRYDEGYEAVATDLPSNVAQSAKQFLDEQGIQSVVLDDSNQEPTHYIFRLLAKDTFAILVRHTEAASAKEKLKEIDFFLTYFEGENGSRPKAKP